jgi:hypothetical protein
VGAPAATLPTVLATHAAMYAAGLDQGSAATHDALTAYLDD